jgi:Zn-dependent protease
MKHCLRIGTIRGVPIRVHWSFGLLVLLFIALTAGSGGSAVLAALAWLVMLFASVVFHEMAHSTVARRRGIEVRDIILLPIGGVSEIPDLGRTADDELAISVAGPASSALLAVALAAVGVAVGGALWPPSIFTGSILIRLAWVNLLLAGFNFLPALPLDGGRVLRAWLSRKRGDLAATELASQIGQSLAVGMMVLGFFVDVWLLLIGVFVFLGARSEAQMARVKAALGGRLVGDLAAGGTMVLRDTEQVAEVLGPGAGVPPSFPVAAAPVVGDGGYLGMAYPHDLLRAPPGAHVGDVADRGAPLLDPATPLFPEAWEAFATSRRPVLAVGAAGRVSGVIYLEDLQETMRRAQPVGR